GDVGLGKTRLAQQFAARTGRRYLRFDCANISSPNGWWGSREAVGGETVFLPSPLFLGAQQGDIVILLDELNRGDGDSRGPLMTILDGERRTWVHFVQKALEVGENVVFFSTANLGDRFHDTHALDGGLNDRLGFWIPIDLPPHADLIGIL